MKKLLFAGLLSLFISAPTFAEMKIPRTTSWQGTDDGVDGTWNNDGTYIELYNETASTYPLRMQLSGGGTIIGSTATVGTNVNAALEIGSRDRYIMMPRASTVDRDKKGLGAGDKGLLMYNETTGKLNFWTGTAWEAVTSS